MYLPPRIVGHIYTFPPPSGSNQYPLTDHAFCTDPKRWLARDKSKVWGCWCDMKHKQDLVSNLIFSMEPE